MRTPALVLALSACSALGAAADGSGLSVVQRRELGPNALVVLAGVPTQPVPARSWVLPADARRFHINSQTGDDALDGLAAQAAGPGQGPWRSFGRLAGAGLRPGDAVLLACGSQWQQTLKLPASGTAERPIYVGTDPGRPCAAPPTIHGRLDIPASAWSPLRGAVHRATLAATPLQLFSSAGALSLAHHPNRGHLGNDPASPYLALPSPGNAVPKQGGGTGSNQVTLGPELQLPAGAALEEGLQFHVRTTSWLIDTATVTAVAGRQINLSRSTSYPLQAGWGYYLTGQAWMVDSPGEWHFDAASRVLTCWSPDSAAPGSGVVASVLDTGIDLRDRQHVVVDGVAIDHVGTGIDLRRSERVRIRNASVQDVAERGVNAASTRGATIESSLIARTGLDALGGHFEGEGHAMALTALNNLIRDSGVRLDGDTVLSLPRRSQGAIHAGPDSVVRGNTIVNAGYHGIRLWGNSTVENNLVLGACSVLDDCGAIYAWSSADSAIRNNIVAHTRSPLSGKPDKERHSQSQGLYLDLATSRITVQGNSAADTDNGIQVHVGDHHALEANHLYGNRRGQLWLQETSNARRAAGDLHDIGVSRNLMAAVVPGSSGLRLQTRFGSTAGFGSVNGNRYLDAPDAVAVSNASAGGTRDFSFRQWQSGTASGLPDARDATGNSANAGRSWYSVAGANLVPNAALEDGLAGWSSWNAAPQAAQLLREPCPSGLCARLVAGGSASRLSSPPMALRRGQWYRLSVDLSSDSDAQRVALVLRRAGGAGEAGPSLADRPLGTTAGRDWRRHSVLFRSTLDTPSGNSGARLDVDGIAPGHWLSLARLELVPVQPSALAQVSAILLNAAAAPALLACPFTGAQAASCNHVLDMQTGEPVAWPLRVAAHASTIVHGFDPQLLDADGDGIPDHQDLCPGTPALKVVDASGCALDPR
ncbi:hypothetical protein BurJ1DRAFT_1282 [Burkholderiales bacterium JOSHI_001]|nr:hypothetical protein BurJ1DRAFT_1282 [Burkholderiales bacterium JOSHI_001]